MRSRAVSWVLRAAAFCLLATSVYAAAPTVLTQSKISDESGGFDGSIDPDDLFGWSVAGLGDLNGDSFPDVAVGAPQDDDGKPNAGAVWILFLNAQGRVLDEQKISDTSGNFTGTVYPGDEFGTSVAAIGDLNGDGVGDLAVGAPFDDDGNFDSGAVWILFLNTNGTVSSYQKISDTHGQFSGTLRERDLFGYSVASLGDLDGDGVLDISVGAALDDDGDGIDSGAVWILFLRTDGTVKSWQKISEGNGGFQGSLAGGDAFGNSVAALGDVDGDGVTDLAVGAPQDDSGKGIDLGAVWILFLEADGTVKSHQKISAEAGGFTGPIFEADLFGWGVAAIGDVDGDGVPDVGIGSPLDNAGSGQDKGAIWLVLLRPDGTVKGEQKISEGSGNFTGNLAPVDTFGTSLTAIGDLDANGADDLLVGAPLDDDGGGSDTGAVWVLFMAPPPQVAACGDADESGALSATDALLTLQTAVGSAVCEPCRCDTDNSGAVTAADAQRVLRAAVALSVELNCPECS
jgi:hypothetical protein